MPTKRAILSELTRDELRDNLDFFELEVDDRRVTSQLIDALAGSRKARLDEILPYLSRSRLKELCRAFDLDDSGRRKADVCLPSSQAGRLHEPPRLRLPGDGGGHCHPANATSRPLTLARPAASGKNSAEHAFRKRLRHQSKTQRPSRAT